MLARRHSAEFYSNVWLVQLRKPAHQKRNHHLPVHYGDPHAIPGLYQLLPLHSHTSVGDEYTVRSHFLDHPREPARETGLQSPKQMPDLPSERETARWIFVSGLGSVCHLLAPSSNDELRCLFCWVRGGDRQNLLCWHPAVPLQLRHEPRCVCIQGRKDQKSLRGHLEAVYHM